MTGEGVARLFAPAMAEGPFPEHYEPFETPIGTNPLHPKVVSNPAARVFKGDMESFGKSDEFPYVGDHVSPDRALPLLDEERPIERGDAAVAVRRDQRDPGEG